MSLVNDMLNDLDARRSQQPRDEENLDWLKAQPKPSRKNVYWPLALVSLLLMVVAAAIIGWLYSSDPVLDAMVEKINGEKTAEVNKQQRPAAANTLSSIRFSNTGDSTVMVLGLNQTAPYQLEQQGEQLSIRLLNVGNGLQARDLKPRAPVASMAIQQTNDAVTLILVLTGRFSYRAKMLSGTPPQLEVTITSHAADARVVDSAGGDKRLSVDSKSGSPKSVAINTAMKKNVAATSSLASKRKPAAVQTVKKALPSSPRQRDSQIARTARNLLDAGDIVAAQQILSDFIQQQPLARRSGEILASILLSQRRFVEVEELLTPLRGVYPGDIKLLAIEARRLLLTAKTQQSVDLLMSVRPAVEGNSDYYELLALAARQNKQYQLSEQVYRGLLDIDSSQGDWWIGMAIAMDAQGKIPQAKTAYRQALKTRRSSEVLANYARQRLAQ